VAHHLLHLGISPAEKAIRTVAVYLALLVLLHLSGKRQLAQLNSFDLVVLLLLSNVVQNAIIGNDNSLIGGLLGAAILLAANYALVHFAFMSPRFGKAIQGGSVVVAKDGKADEKELRKLAVTHEEFIAGLRRQGLELEDTELVTLEPEGVFSAQPRPKPTIEDVMRKLGELELKLAQRDA
jgi:uncharacterized membrane protein YcaP (DUF421 family)